MITLRHVQNRCISSFSQKALIDPKKQFNFKNHTFAGLNFRLGKIKILILSLTCCTKKGEKETSHLGRDFKLKLYSCFGVENEHFILE